MEEFKYGGTNITAFRLVDPESLEIRKIVRDWSLGVDTKFKKMELPPLDVVSNYKTMLNLFFHLHLIKKKPKDVFSVTERQLDYLILSFVTCN